ncbi:MAG: hypothetical protein A2W26_07525 [Acidobacteria bacterium RBG_16_64_8]|nr:MAG: hypothetical protein A2W26_07525 [Acidobacteria bacterium RBG_16_64_8]
MTENGQLITQVPRLHADAFAGAFELLTTTLRLNGGQAGTRVVSVTAPRAKDGASTVAGNLAVTVAATGRKVLLVDANFRAPALHQLFHVNPRPGLAEVLARGASVNDVIQAGRVPNLWVLAAGAMTGSPHGRLESHELDAVFEHLRSRYDFIVVDTPPVLQYADALHLARVTNGTLLVLSDGAPLRGAQEARRRFDRVQANVLGVVMNRGDPKVGAGA